jgi:hypothetical protein
VSVIRCFDPTSKIDHCYHIAGAVFNIDNKILGRPAICCNCGAGRITYLGFVADEGKHGPHMQVEEPDQKPKPQLLVPNKPKLLH